MNTFDKKLEECGFYPLKAEDITTLQANIGYKCNLACIHCHVEASPDRTEQMSLSTMYKVMDILEKNPEITTLDITGGSPELNPNFAYLVKSAADIGKKVLVRTNLAVYSGNGVSDIPEFLRGNKAKIIASLPCYTEAGVDSVRGKGTYKKAIAALKRFNGLGYGIEGTGLEIDIMFNPAKAEIAPDQRKLEISFKQKLKEIHGVSINHLVALNNMPIGRLKRTMSNMEQVAYLTRLAGKFNPATVKNVMCRHLISVSPDGRLFDCDFWQMLNLPVKSECSTIDNFDYEKLSKREIVTNALCLMCTAGAGASCSGALVDENEEEECSSNCTSY